MSQVRPPSHQAAEPSQVIALRWQARALAPMPEACSAPPSSSSSASSSYFWLVGTAAAREQNELDVVEYDAASREVRCAASWAHPAEVWAVAAHPSSSGDGAGSGGGGGGGGGQGLLVATAWRASPTPQHCRAAAGGGGGGGAGDGDDEARAARPGWGATVWRAPSLGAGGSRTAALSRACDLEPRSAAGGGLAAGGGGGGAAAAQQRRPADVPVRAVAWSPHQSDEVLTADADGTLRTWRIGDGGEARVQATCGGGGGNAGGGGGGSGGGGGAGDARQELWAAEPHPRQPGLLAVATDAGVLVYDTRAAALVGTFGCAAGSASGGGGGGGRCPACGLARWRRAARCVGWPSDGGFRLTSAGDDGRLRFWDLRALSSSSPAPSPSPSPRCSPVQTLGGGHGHAITHLAHHPQRGDALLATAGSDGAAALWHTPQAASAGAAGGSRRGAGAGAGVSAGGGGSGGEGEAGEEEDGRVWSWDDPTAGGDDALRGVAWASPQGGGGGGGGGGGQRDAWSLAALAHDGRVAVHHVPRAVRYAVLV